MVKRFPKRGEVFWVNLDPTIGSEAQKLRPGLILSNDIGNELSHLVIIAPITSRVDEVYPFEVSLIVKGSKGEGKLAKAMINQCRAVDKSRLKSKICDVSIEVMNRVDEAIKIVFSIA